MRSILQVFTAVKQIGSKGAVSPVEKNKLPIFNLINFFSILFMVSLMLFVVLSGNELSAVGWLLYFLFAATSTFILYLTSRFYYETARMIYFISYPLLAALLSISGSATGLELFFVFYAFLGAFMLEKKANIIVCLFVSMLIYSCLFLFGPEEMFQTGDLTSDGFYVFNQLLAMVFMFHFIFRMRNTNHRYQHKLMEANEEIAEKKEKVESQLMQLQKQATELEELNAIKTKLFSVVAHDLRTPLYALRNMFTNVQKYDISGDEIKEMIPDVLTDLGYTTGLMENLLQWARSQMKTDVLHPQMLDISMLINETIQLMRLQAENKKVYLENKLNKPVYIFADKNIVKLVLRNLLSNAIKFTPSEGRVIAGANNTHSFVEVFVEDTGIGMDESTLRKINSNNFFSNPGTVNEQGAGLGLMLCKEFVKKSGGRMLVESKPGEGSIFSFTLPATIQRS